MIRIMMGLKMCTFITHETMSDMLLPLLVCNMCGAKMLVEELMRSIVLSDLNSDSVTKYLKDGGMVSHRMDERYSKL